MKHTIAILAALWLSAASLLAALGDIIGASVRSDGWTMKITMDDLATGGTYNTGWVNSGGVLNLAPSSVPRIVLTVASAGFTSTGTPTTNIRTVHGTIPLVTADLAETIQHQVVGGDLEVIIGLNEWIYANDTVTVSILNDIYVNGATSSSPVTNLAVTNQASHSANGYFPVDFGWTRPPSQLVSGSTLTVSCWASDRHADGQPARCVRFTATDGTTTQTIIKSTMEKRPMPGDHNPSAEFVADFDNTQFIQGATVTVNASAYPFIGDASNVFNTTSYSAQPTYDPGPLTFVCNKTGAYGTSIALVDAATGVDATGVAYDPATYNPVTAAKFATVAGAAVKIAARNNTVYGRNDLSGSVVEVLAGNQVWLGPSGAFGTTPATWLTIRPAAGVADHAVVFNSSSGVYDLTDRVRVERCKLSMTGSGPTGCNMLWLDRNWMESTGTSVISGNTFVWATGNKIKNWATGLKTFSTANIGGYVLVRGNEFDGFRNLIISPMIIANTKVDRTSVSPSVPNLFIQDGNGGSQGPSESAFVVYNKFLGIAGQGIKYINQVAYMPVRGVTIAENLFESVSNATNYALFQFSASDQYNQFVNNVKIWNNTVIGERHFIAYNSTGTQPVWYLGWSLKNNIAWEYNIKDNNHDVSSSARIGNWSILYGVGQSGNLHADSGTGDQFNNRWAGINSRQDIWGTNFAFYDFIDYKASVETGDPDSLGLGDYHLGAASPARDLAYQLVTPYDVEGNARSLPDSAGAFTTSSGGAPNTPPSISITSPLTGTTNVSPVSFSGVATDSQDGTISSTIEWSSNVSGVIGTGTSISASLPVGTHIISAHVTDSGALTSSASITIVVTRQSVINATTTQVGTLITK